MFCKNCGGYIRSKGNYCERCKELLIYSRKDDLDKELSDEYYHDHDRTSFGLVFISFILPVIGIILYFVNKKHMPRKSHVIMASMLIGCIVWCFVFLFCNVVYSMDKETFISFEQLL